MSQGRNSSFKAGSNASTKRSWSATFLLVILLSVVFTPVASPVLSQEGELLAYEYRVSGDRNHTQILIHFDREPEVKWFLLRAPHRLVIDLPESQFAFDDQALSPQGLVARVRYGLMSPGHSRIIFTMPGPFTIDDLSITKDESSPGYRLSIEVIPASEDIFEKAMHEHVPKAPDSSTTATSPGNLSDDGRFTIVLDPGHGGIDGGAQGASGIDEKIITLAFALELREKLEQAGDYNVILTRDSDVFLRLDERVQIARDNKADLFISIHADSIRLRDFRGATVYTLSERASDAEAAATAARENLSDEIAGFVAEEPSNEVADILIDLVRRETHAFSIRFGRTLVGELKNTVEFVSNPLRSAGFLVLRAPDIPSVLLELGYLSNPEDEKLMRDPAWRSRAADKVVDAIAIFAEVSAGG